MFLRCTKAINKGREQNAILRIHLFEVGSFPIITALYDNTQGKS